MPRWGIRLFLLAIFLFSFLLSLSLGRNQSNANSEATPSGSLRLRTERSSSVDLELSGDLVGTSAGESRYLRREDLLALPQVSYTVSDDANFKGSTKISGVPLEELSKRLSAKPQSDMIIGVCSDLYRANYPRVYMLEHQPLLVVLVNGQPPADWPKDSEGHNAYMGPYLISHPKFVPAFHVLSIPEEPQIPWGVVRLEFRDEKETFAAIAPRGAQANLAEVQAGYRIAAQHCFRCHNQGSEGGQKAGRPWAVLSAWATASPQYFAAYVRDPKSKNPRAAMPGNPNYDDATLRALISYFRTFNSQEKP
jgi:mono/diheme cytochrome c family protein